MAEAVAFQRMVMPTPYFSNLFGRGVRSIIVAYHRGQACSETRKVHSAKRPRPPHPHPPLFGGQVYDCSLRHTDQRKRGQAAFPVVINSVRRTCTCCPPRPPHRIHSQRDSIANYLFFLKENNWLLAHFGYQIDLFGPCEAGMAQSDQNWRMGIGSPQSRQKILNRRLTQINADQQTAKRRAHGAKRPGSNRRLKRGVRSMIVAYNSYQQFSTE